MTWAQNSRITAKTLGIAALTIMLAVVALATMSQTVLAAEGDATGAPVIKGIPQVAQVLIADTFSVDDPDGISGATFSYQWIRVASDDTESNISRATGSTYRLKTGDSGKNVKILVSFTDDAGNAESLTSAAFPGTGTVTTPAGPVTTSATTTVIGTFVSITFNENLASGSNAPPTSAFRVKLNGHPVIAATSGISGRRVNLTGFTPENEPVPAGALSSYEPLTRSRSTTPTPRRRTTQLPSRMETATTAQPSPISRSQIPALSPRQGPRNQHGTSQPPQTAPTKSSSAGSPDGSTGAK